MAQDGAKLEPSWRQDGPSWGQHGHLEAIWGGILSILVVLGAIFKKMAKVENRTRVQRFGYILGSWGVWLEALGEDFGRSWPQVGLSWKILASSWELLGKMLGLR